MLKSSLQCTCKEGCAAVAPICSVANLVFIVIKNFTLILMMDAEES